MTTNTTAIMDDITKNTYGIPTCVYEVFDRNGLDLYRSERNGSTIVFEYAGTTEYCDSFKGFIWMEEGKISDPAAWSIAFRPSYDCGNYSVEIDGFNPNEESASYVAETYKEIVDKQYQVEYELADLIA